MADTGVYKKVPEEFHEPEVLEIDETAIQTYEDPNGNKCLSLFFLCICSIGLICCIVLILIVVLVVVTIISYSGNLITS